MLTINKITVENTADVCITDNPRPQFGIFLQSNAQDAALTRVTVQVGNWETSSVDQLITVYNGPALKPFTTYEVKATVALSNGETAEASRTFETGRMDTPWQGQWISDADYSFAEKKVSPRPMTFRRSFGVKKQVVSAQVLATAMGIYEMKLNGKKVGDRYFAPGFTSYKTNLMYQTYDVTDLLNAENELIADVAGGWAVGSFVFSRVNRVTADRQALLAEIRIVYADGTAEVIGTDNSWDVSEEGPFRMADLYDGETYDANISYDAVSWHKAAPETLRVKPTLTADYSAPVKVNRVMTPVSFKRMPDGSTVYDFAQNFSGVVSVKLNAKKGQKVTIRHGEIVDENGQPNYDVLRSAKATAEYICKEGEQTYSPTMTYMGFRYVQVYGIEPEQIEVTALVLTSQIDRIGSFTCSDPLINRLEENIYWSSISNFVDIPTDCPQRDERMGWTGDIAVFAPTACFHFDMTRFLNKWLKDVRAEQLPSGGLPNTVPVQGYGFPATMPEMAVAFWGDASVMVPWAMYQATGDLSILRDNYEMMKRYVKACRFWAGIGIGKGRYIWQMPGVFSFGDWLASDSPKMSQWQARNKWTGTASLFNTSSITARVARLLGKADEAEHYSQLADKVADAYRCLLMDGNGKLKTEFQTGYVLPIHFGMLKDDEKHKATENLAHMVKENDYCIATGFPGTPYILFALADNGQEETAFRMLTNTKCPSWLYEVRVGGTTIWERWNGLNEQGLPLKVEDGTDNMISYNHYASGAVGDFLYRRVAGLEATAPAYRSFRVKPLIGGGMTSARAAVNTPYGEAASDWKIENGTFTITVCVPVSTCCELILPNGESKKLSSGCHTFNCLI